MDERYLHEAAAPLIALARISQQIGADGSAALSNGALLLLEQMLSLCSAQRGALLLPRGSSIAQGVVSLLAPAPLEGVRILAKLGMSEEHLLPLLVAFGSAGADVRTTAEAPGWLLYRIPLNGASARHADEPAGSSPAEPSSLAHFPLDALLVLGWNVTEHDPSFNALEKGRTLLPLVADVAGVILTNLLLVERLHEQETVMKQQAPREREVFQIELLANVSHELRSPLTSIKGYTETLLRLDRRTSRQQRREFLLTIKEACDEQAVVIDRLLAVCRREQKKGAEQ